ncbi:hypothetical protein [Nocardia phage NBR1]|uniref:hypothetical protein n=1 Tax=Nocardia phage NBR1 TaxID=1109711 RepID=UPI00023EEDF5|nr:hypothetical protein NoPhNBR1_gp50 [Nocardia phage NBR1]AEV52263.1 hypothetical protein [Nocardia phage NBR1]
MTTTGPFREALEAAAAQGYVTQSRSPFARVQRQAAPKGPVARPASDRQLAFLQKLIGESAELYAAAGRDIEAEAVRRTLVTMGPELAAMSSADASAAIDRAIKSNKGLRSTLATLEDDRRAKAAEATAALENGVYRLPDGTVVTVRHTRQSRIQVGYVWDADAKTFEYSGRRILRQLNAGMRLSVEECAEFGQETIVCCVCMTPLENEESRRLGIGPVCRRKY